MNQPHKLSKRNDWGRRLRSFKRHCLLLYQPALEAVAVVIGWYFARLHGTYLPKEDETPLTGAVITTLAVAYSITATLVFGTIWDKYQKVVLCVLKQDKDTFLCYRDERIPIIVHLLMLSLSVPLLVMIALLEYKSVYSGALSVFSVSFVLALYWTVIMELQNPAKSLWLAERIPNEWLSIDIDQHFFAEKNGG